MGGGIARMLLEKRGVEIVGAIERRPELIGCDLGEVFGLGRLLGVEVSGDPESVLSRARADVVLQATGSFVHEVESDILLAVRHGCNLISTAEEMACPQATNPDAAARLDRAAREVGVSVFGTGINPGFVLDLLIIALTAACRRVDSVTARRVNDLSPFGPTVMRSQGVGTTPEEFDRGVATGAIVGHVGFQQSIRLIADAVGWRLDRVEERREPIISKVARRAPHATVEPGMVAGCNHTGIGYADGRAVITLLHPQQIQPQAEGVLTGDYIEIEGDPSVRFSGSPEIPGGIGTMAVVVNYIPLVVAARPGLLTLNDLPVPAARMGDMTLSRRGLAL